MRQLAATAALLLLGCGGVAVADKNPAAIAAASGLALVGEWKTVAEEHEKRAGGVDVYVLHGARPLASLPQAVVASLPQAVAIPAETALKAIAVYVKASELGQPSSAVADSAGWKNASGEWTATQVVTDKGAWLWLQRIAK